MNRLVNSGQGDHDQIDKVEDHDQIVKGTLVFRICVAVENQAGAQRRKDQDHRQKHRNDGERNEAGTVNHLALEPDFRKQKPGIAEDRLTGEAVALSIAMEFISDY